MASNKVYDEDSMFKQSESFTQRPRSVPAIKLTWEHLCLFGVKKVGRRQYDEIPILKDISGQANPGEVLAIMGPSAAGKSSLMNVLSGWTKGSKDKILTGEIKANGIPISQVKFNKLAGNVLTEDILLANLTVRESIEFSLNLRTNWNEDKKRQRVDQLIQELLLIKVEHSLVGPDKARGISDGEKKRVSIGIELVTNPSVLFLDEPTSGLDSFTALAIVKLIRQQADHGRTVICTLYQPSFQIMELVDNLLVMMKGHIIYHNSPLLVREWFEDMGFKFPQLGSPVDYLMHILSDAPDNKFTNEEDKLQVSLAKYKANMPAIVPVQEGNALLDYHPQHADNWSQFKYLLMRSTRDTFRPKKQIVTKICVAIFLSSMFDMVFYGFGFGYNDIRKRQGSFFILNICIFLSGLIQVSMTFPLQRAVLIKEQGFEMYNIHIYYWTKLIPELFMEVLYPTIFFVIMYWAEQYNNSSYDKPLIFWGLLLLGHASAGSLGLFIACLVMNMKLLSTVGNLIFMPMIIFGGFLVNLNSIPEAIRWISYGSLFRYAHTGMCQNEFHGITFACETDPTAFGYPCDPLGSLNIDIDLWLNIVILASITVALRLLTPFVLVWTVKRFYN